MLLSRFFCGCVVLCLLWACNKESSNESATSRNTGELNMVFDHSVRDLPLDFVSEYVNDWGETYTVQTFKYYIHNIRLRSTDGTITSFSSDYYLVDQEFDSTKHIRIKLPPGNYNSILYTVGVDSARNFSGAQTGVLDPTNGMFWAWTSGYVMAKLEGHSAFSTGSSEDFTYHVGGYRSPYITIKEIALPVPSDELISITKDSASTVHINADINTWFSRVQQVKIADNPACHSPGELSKKLADNYEGMFSIKSLN